MTSGGWTTVSVVAGVAVQVLAPDRIQRIDIDAVQDGVVIVVRVAGVALAIGVRIEAVIGPLAVGRTEQSSQASASRSWQTRRVQRVKVHAVQDGVVIIVRIQRIAAQVSIGVQGGRDRIQRVGGR